MLTGGAGKDGLSGGEGDDVFVLGGANEGRDIVGDFSFGTKSGESYYDGTTKGGDDRIRVDTANGNETTIEALKAAAQIRWTQDSDGGGSSSYPSYDDRTKNDTIIYATKGTADISDDVAIMVLLDFTEELTMAIFEVV